eukprot:TRINITY_DN12795_c0_g2_i1.p1 TRINITY_DN12795_c0_g2~~TRINITY_DN12795_c0_g2_i1.p1  ORF type:complete len:1745 (+),score=296.75 TRINITY_DN12795_c0_g2_i1:47-5236(+)
MLASRPPQRPATARPPGRGTERLEIASCRPQVPERPTSAQVRKCLNRRRPPSAGRWRAEEDRHGPSIQRLRPSTAPLRRRIVGEVMSNRRASRTQLIRMAERRAAARSVDHLEWRHTSTLLERYWRRLQHGDAACGPLRGRLAAFAEATRRASARAMWRRFADAAKPYRQRVACEVLHQRMLLEEEFMRVSVLAVEEMRQRLKNEASHVSWIRRVTAAASGCRCLRAGNSLQLHVRPSSAPNAAPSRPSWAQQSGARTALRCLALMLGPLKMSTAPAVVSQALAMHAEAVCDAAAVASLSLCGAAAGEAAAAAVSRRIGPVDTAPPSASDASAGLVGVALSAAAAGCAAVSAAHTATEAAEARHSAEAAVAWVALSAAAAHAGMAAAGLAAAERLAAVVVVHSGTMIAEAAHASVRRCRERVAEAVCAAATVAVVAVREWAVCSADVVRKTVLTAAGAVAAGVCGEIIGSRIQHREQGAYEGAVPAGWVTAPAAITVVIPLPNVSHVPRQCAVMLTRNSVTVTEAGQSTVIAETEFRWPIEVKTTRIRWKSDPCKLTLNGKVRYMPPEQAAVRDPAVHRLEGLYVWPNEADNDDSSGTWVPSTLSLLLHVPEIESLSETPLDVSSNGVRVVLPSAEPLVEQFPWPVDSAAALVDFDSETKCITITASVDIPTCPTYPSVPATREQRRRTHGSLAFCRQPTQVFQHGKYDADDGYTGCRDGVPGALSMVIHLPEVREYSVEVSTSVTARLVRIMPCNQPGADPIVEESWPFKVDPSSGFASFDLAKHQLTVTAAVSLISSRKRGRAGLTLPRRRQARRSCSGSYWEGGTLQGGAFQPNVPKTVSLSLHIPEASGGLESFHTDVDHDRVRIGKPDLPPLLSEMWPWPVDTSTATAEWDGERMVLVVRADVLLPDSWLLTTPLQRAAAVIDVTSTFSSVSDSDRTTNVVPVTLDGKRSVRVTRLPGNHQYVGALLVNISVPEAAVGTENLTADIQVQSISVVWINTGTPIVTVPLPAPIVVSTCRVTFVMEHQEVIVEAWIDDVVSSDNKGRMAWISGAGKYDWSGWAERPAMATDVPAQVVVEAGAPLDPFHVTADTDKIVVILDKDDEEYLVATLPHPINPQSVSWNVDDATGFVRITADVSLKAPTPTQEVAAPAQPEQSESAKGPEPHVVVRALGTSMRKGDRPGTPASILVEMWLPPSISSGADCTFDISETSIHLGRLLPDGEADEFLVVPLGWKADPSTVSMYFDEAKRSFVARIDTDGQPAAANLPPSTVQITPSPDTPASQKRRRTVRGASVFCPELRIDVDGTALSFGDFAQRYGRQSTEQWERAMVAKAASGFATPMGETPQATSRSSASPLPGSDVSPPHSIVGERATVTQHRTTDTDLDQSSVRATVSKQRVSGEDGEIVRVDIDVAAHLHDKKKLEITVGSESISLRHRESDAVFDVQLPWPIDESRARAFFRKSTPRISVRAPVKTEGKPSVSAEWELGQYVELTGLATHLEHNGRRGRLQFLNPDSTAVVTFEDGTNHTLRLENLRRVNDPVTPGEWVRLRDTGNEINDQEGLVTAVHSDKTVAVLLSDGNAVRVSLLKLLHSEFRQVRPLFRHRNGQEAVDGISVFADWDEESEEPERIGRPKLICVEVGLDEPSNYDVQVGDTSLQITAKDPPDSSPLVDIQLFTLLDPAAATATYEREQQLLRVMLIPVSESKIAAVAAVALAGTVVAACGYR